MRRQWFSQRWFFNNAAEFTATMKSLAGRPIRYLEIGVYEGASALWMFENVLTHPESRAVLIDWWNQERWSNLWKSAVEVEAQARRLLAPYASQVEILKGDRLEMLKQLQGQRFDVAYIDGSHERQDVLDDSLAVWPMVEVGGLVLWDDYRWRIGRSKKFRPPTQTQAGIDEFLATVQGQYEVLASGAQLHVRKVG